MRWRHVVGTGLFTLVMSTGCPSEFGRDGRVNKAVGKDVKEFIPEDCPVPIFQKYCSDGRDNTPECIRECG
jgi:hypothetical protein